MSVSVCAYQLWGVGTGCKSRQDRDHEQAGSNVDSIGPKILLSNVPVQAARKTIQSVSPVSLSDSPISRKPHMRAQAITSYTRDSKSSTSAGYFQEGEWLSPVT